MVVHAGDLDLEEAPVHPFEKDLAWTALFSYWPVLSMSIHGLFVYYFAKEAGA